MSVGMRSIEELTEGQLRELDEMLEEGKGDLNIPWHEEHHFERFVLDEGIGLVGVYVVRGSHGVADVRAWLRRDRRTPDVSLSAAEMIASHLTSRVVTTFSLEPSLVGFDEKSERLLRMVVEPP